ncbi:MAG: hypothetical protein WBL25_09070 [Anaerolineales bacterium]
MLADLALVCNFNATSDLPQWLGADEREELRAFLEADPQIERTGRYTFTIDGRKVDFSPAIPLPPPPRGLETLGSAFLGWTSNRSSSSRAVPGRMATLNRSTARCEMSCWLERSFIP